MEYFSSQNIMKTLIRITDELATIRRLRMRGKVTRYCKVLYTFSVWEDRLNSNFVNLDFCEKYYSLFFLFLILLRWTASVV